MADAFDIPERFCGDDVIDVCGNKQVLKIITKQAPSENTKKPTAGNEVSVHYVGTLTEKNNSVEFDSSRSRGEPIKFNAGEGKVIRGWDAVLMTMCKGERCEVLIQAEYAYGPAARGKIPANAALIFDMELMDFIGEMTNETPEEFKAEGVVDVCGNGKVLKLITRAGDGGMKPMEGTTASLHYTGTLVNGKQFDSSRDRGEPFDTPVGKGQVIRGWDEVMPTMTVNERCKVLIKSDYAYGPNGSPPTIPPNAALIFDMELLGVSGEDLSEAKDKSITRIIMNSSEKYTQPEIQDTVTVTVQKLGVEKPLFDKLVFTLGEEELHEGMDLSITACILKMTQEEKSQFTLSVSHPQNNSGSSVTYVIEVHDLQVTQRYWEMEESERIAACDTYKNAGTTFLKDGKIKTALGKYEYVLTITDNDMPKDADLKKQLTDFRMSAMLNMSLCKLKLKDYLHVIQLSNDILELDSENEKAWYRKGSAHANLNDHLQAKDCFSHIVKNINPDNKQAIKMLHQSNKKVKDAVEKEQKLARKMFGL